MPAFYYPNSITVYDVYNTKAMEMFHYLYQNFLDELLFTSCVILFFQYRNRE